MTPARRALLHAEARLVERAELLSVRVDAGDGSVWPAYITTVTALAAVSDRLGAEGVGVIDGAVFALPGLLLAFTFSGAAARFDTRRHLIVEEANAIGTAYLRLDLLPPDA